MDPHRWRRAYELFHAVVSCTEDDRSALLSAACGDDSELRGFIERMVTAHAHAATFMDSAAARQVREALAPARVRGASQPTLEPYPPGDEFRGTSRFEVRRELGRGGMGVVLEAFDRHRGETVALKTLRHSSPAELYRLKREFRSLADVAHPNLVALYELVVDDANCFFTMELVDGVDFVSYAEGASGPEGTPKNERIRQALLQLTEGIADLHRRGKVHRDIKPSNILVTRDDRVVILDFGLTSDVVDEQAADRAAGTPAFFAPERTAGAAPSPAQDWYSVGVTLYRALTGHLPFGVSTPDIRRRQWAREPQPPREAAGNIPDDLDAVCMGLLRSDPATRFTGQHVWHVLTREHGVGTRLPPRPHAAHFVGRDSQLAILAHSWSMVRSGDARAVHVRGPSGIGKSGLIDWFLESAGIGLQGLVLRGRCDEHESVPYKAVDGVIDSLSQHLRAMPHDRVRQLLPADASALSRLFPVLLGVGAIPRPQRSDREDPMAVRQRAFAAARELLMRLAAGRPLLIYIDDVHWADADSVVLLAELLRPPALRHVLTITCGRSDEIAANPALESLLRDADVVLPLSRLSVEESRSMITSLSTVPIESGDVQEIVDQAAGNPFLLRELIRYASAPVVECRPRPTLDEMVHHVMQTLPAGATPFLQTLAVGGRPMAADLVSEAAGVSAGRSLLHRLQSSHLVRSSGSAERLELYHDGLREPIVSALARDERRVLHGQIARAMAARGSDDHVALFDHFREADDPARAAFHASAAAATADAALAFDRASHLYQAALDLAPDATEAPAWRQELAAAHAHAGRPLQSAMTYLEAACAAPAGRHLDLERRAGEQFLLGGHIDRGLATMQSVLQAVGVRVPVGPRRTVAALAWQRAALWWRGLEFQERPTDRIGSSDLLRTDTCWSVASGLALVDTLRAAHFQTRCLLLALETGEPSRIARSLAVESAFLAATGGKGVGRAAALLRQAQQIAAAAGNPHAIALCVLIDGLVAFMVGRWADAHASSGRALTMFREQGREALWESALAQRFVIGSLMYMGRIRETEATVRQLLATSRENGNVYWDTELHTGASLIWLAQDAPDEAIRRADEAIARWSHEGFHRQHYNHVLAHVQAEIYMGRGEQAWRLLSARWGAIRRSLLMRRIRWTRIEASYWRARCALVAAEQGFQRRQCLAAARSAARGIRGEGLPWSTAVASLLDAALASLDGDTARARRLLEDAISRFDAAGMALHAAAARRRSSELADRESGRDHKRQADAWMTAQGIVNPARITRLVAPGFTDPPEAR